MLAETPLKFAHLKQRKLKTDILSWLATRYHVACSNVPFFKNVCSMMMSSYSLSNRRRITRLEKEGRRGSWREEKRIEEKSNVQKREELRARLRAGRTVNVCDLLQVDVSTGVGFCFSLH